MSIDAILVSIVEATATACASLPRPADGMIDPVALVFLLVFSLPCAFVCARLAGEKGLSPWAWGLAGVVPFFGFFSMMYVVGTPSRARESTERSQG